jgi:hypothetical protein
MNCQDVTFKMMREIKEAAEKAIGHQCTIRHKVNAPNVLEIEFDMQDTSGH